MTNPTDRDARVAALAAARTVLDLTDTRCLEALNLASWDSPDRDIVAALLAKAREVARDAAADPARRRRWDRAWTAAVADGDYPRALACWYRHAAEDAALAAVWAACQDDPHVAAEVAARDADVARLWAARAEESATGPCVAPGSPEPSHPHPTHPTTTQEAQ